MLNFAASKPGARPHPPPSDPQLHLCKWTKKWSTPISLAHKFHAKTVNYFCS